MIDYADDHEQWQMIKAWWQKNGKLVLGIIILGLAIGFGYQFWQRHQTQKAQQASALYDQLITTFHATPQDAKKIDRLVNQLQGDYASTPYASLAALLSAKFWVDQGNLSQARSRLDWVMRQGSLSDFRQIARLRSARILLAQKQGDAALALLSTVDNSAFLPAIFQVKGEIYISQGKLKEARQAYQMAKMGLPDSQPISQYLELELNRL